MASKTLAIVVVCLAVCSLAAAHGLLTNPVPRSGTNDAAKNPCTNTAGTIAATYEAGTTVNMGWDIHACHCGNGPGTVTWSISYTGDVANFETITTTSQPAAGPQTTAIALPSGKTCDNCILRWNWQPSSENAPYIGCADIKITGKNNEDVLCKSGLIKCSSATTLSFSALLAFFALLALLL